MGRDVQKLRQMQQELEIKQAHEERLREKAEEAAAREKVRQQIAQDKLERKQKELALQVSIILIINDFILISLSLIEFNLIKVSFILFNSNRRNDSKFKNNQNTIQCLVMRLWREFNLDYHPEILIRANLNHQALYALYATTFSKISIYLSDNSPCRRHFLDGNWLTKKMTRLYCNLS